MTTLPITIVNYRQHLAAAGHDWQDVRQWALTVRDGKTLRWSPKQLAGNPAGVAIAYLEAGCPAPNAAVLRARGNTTVAWHERGDSRARGVDAAAGVRAPSGEKLLADAGVSWRTVVHPWALQHGWTTRMIKLHRVHRGAALAYLEAHAEGAERGESCAS